MNTPTPSARLCTHWAFTATLHGRRVRYRCAQPGCHHRWRRTHRSYDRARGVA